MREILALLEHSLSNSTELDTWTALLDQALKADRLAVATLLVCPLDDNLRWRIIITLALYCEPLSGREAKYEWDCIKIGVKLCHAKLCLDAYQVFIDEGKNNARTRRLGRLIWDLMPGYGVLSDREGCLRLLRHIHYSESHMDEAHAFMSRFLFGKVSKPSGIEGCECIDDFLLAKGGEYSKMALIPPWVARGLLSGKTDGIKSKYEYDFEKAGGYGELQLRHVFTHSNRDYFPFYRAIEVVSALKMVPGIRDEVIDVWMERIKQVSWNVPSKLAIVLDNSTSMDGYDLAFAETVARLLDAQSDATVYFVGESSGDEFSNILGEPVMPSGVSDFMMPIARAISDGHKHVYLLTDGFENRDNGAVDQLLNLKAVKDSGICFYQISPNPYDPLVSSRLKRLRVFGLEAFPLKERIISFHQEINHLITYLEQIKMHVLKEEAQEAVAAASFSWIPVTL